MYQAQGWEFGGNAFASPKARRADVTARERHDFLSIKCKVKILKE
jgi:hypothetical protein